MPTSNTLITFMGAALAVLLVPGPSVAYVMSRSIAHGRAAGLVSMLGLETGAMLHMCAAAGGVAALVAASHPVYAALRYGGAAYLVFLGIREIRAAVGPEGASAEGVVTRGRLYRDGVLVDLLNPKSALFFLAFLPQFVEPVRGSMSGQVMVLGCCFVVLAVVCDTSYALIAGSFSRRLKASVRAQLLVNRATGCVFIALGVFACAA
ncbi:RhtB family transporter [Flexivirga endophytica]|uniref:RhtB family transporter n=1 Tax=Flexivirga endophytica TaxID=1849103 RepID=A0A916TGP0_9MICO|nr:LysE family translocator [Flexivirga endophytica]GGB43016.1 RhtB family transporter [Flexivirga endophytica]GHB64506.1 RhtB family transporter [Flexivirga endophytica]